LRISSTPHSDPHINQSTRNPEFMPSDLIAVKLLLQFLRSLRHWVPAHLICVAVRSRAFSPRLGRLVIHGSEPPHHRHFLLHSSLQRDNKNHHKGVGNKNIAAVNP
ncbi:Protein ALWAYS EARLY 3, partial [Clarias magur]